MTAIAPEQYRLEAHPVAAPVLRLMAPNLPSADELLPYLRRIDAARHYTNFGPLVQQFERELTDTLIADGRAQTGVELVTVNSGTAALQLALAALDLPAGSRVLVPAFTFPATVHAIRLARLEPVFVDVDPETWSLTPAIAQAALARVEAAAVMPVAAFGAAQPAGAWDTFARATGLKVVIDAAAAFGSQYVGRNVTVCFSLHATKPFGIGEGGLVVSYDGGLVDKVRRDSNFGFARGAVEHIGTNAKLSEYHAAVGLAQLRRWPMVQTAVRRAYAHYRRVLVASELDVSLQKITGFHVPSVLPVQLNADAATVAERLAGVGIPTRRWYTPASDRQAPYAECLRVGPDGRALPVTRVLESRLIGLPFHSYLRTQDIRLAVQCLTDALNG